MTANESERSVQTYFYCGCKANLKGWILLEEVSKWYFFQSDHDRIRRHAEGEDEVCTADGLYRPPKSREGRRQKGSGICSILPSSFYDSGVEIGRRLRLMVIRNLKDPGDMAQSGKKEHALQHEQEEVWETRQLLLKLLCILCVVHVLYFIELITSFKVDASTQKGDRVVSVYDF